MAKMASTTASSLMTTPPSSNPAYPPQQLSDEQLKQDDMDISESNQTQKPANRPKHSQSLKIALAAVDRNRREYSDFSESDSLEDYDTLKPDPMSIVGGGKGGGLDTDTATATEVTVPQTVYAEIKIPSQQSRQRPVRHKSIPVTLNKLQKRGKGQYTFEADDDALRDLLKGTVAHYSQDNKPGELKKRTKFSDCESLSQVLKYQATILQMKWNNKTLYLVHI